MPIFDGGGFEAWIEVDGERLEEFDVGEYENEQGVPVMACWVPCVSGKEFKIGFSLPEKRVKYTHFALNVSMDGSQVEVPSSCVTRDPTVRGPMVLYFGEELVPDGSATRSFRFGSLQLTDDDSMHREFEKLGEIEIGIASVAKLSRRCTASSEAARQVDHCLHERRKKGISHCVEFGKEKPYASDMMDSVTYIGSADICSFQFYYRSIDTLIAEGRVPTSGSGIREREGVRSHSGDLTPATYLPTLAVIKEEPKEDIASLPKTLTSVPNKADRPERAKNKPSKDKSHGPRTRSRVSTVTETPGHSSSRRENATPGPSKAPRRTQAPPHPVEVISISDDSESETSDYESEIEALQDYAAALAKECEVKALIAKLKSKRKRGRIGGPQKERPAKRVKK
ncbi:hypothetical protein FA13DRAFT_1789881 [Coprinellus micaceus]|uniref:DUF7918 domain-containing protein n=1 Tax=Coprinellus micaceus TaxID=71717 RepID=A0A4Y7TGY0_COPMI|nr:hypothetical protein FA13DRAFT_1789881 [Coprinellus micaceus]